MKLSRIGRVSMALVVSVAMVLGMTACGGGTIGFMWVLGTQYNQIAAFKIDDFTGNLTTAVGSPFTSGGSNPVSLVVRTGGRYLYVVNKGGGATSSTSGSLPCGTSGGISEFGIGGQAVLTFQECFTSQGTTPVWAAKDSTGGFLYVLDSIGLGANCDANHINTTACYGDITVFASDPNTGRLSLVLNQQAKDPNTGLQLTYFPVGHIPKMMALSGSCLFTLNSDQTVTSYSAGSSGQLTLTANSVTVIPSTNATSIISGGTSVYITDTAVGNSQYPNGQIIPYTVGSSCSLGTITGGATGNISPGSNPAYSLVDSKNLRLYVANQSSTNTTTPNSTLSAFNILSNSTLQPIPDPGNNPYPIGAAPVCIVEDPSNQYIYTSNGDGTVTGKVLDQRTGDLSNLSRGSTFTAVGQATCLAVSGNVD